MDDDLESMWKQEVVACLLQLSRRVLKRIRMSTDTPRQMSGRSVQGSPSIRLGRCSDDTVSS